MKLPQYLGRRSVSLATAFAMLGALAAPAALSSPAFAAVLGDRKIEMSSSAVSATGVNYQLTFTPSETHAAAVVIVDFCDNSPIIGQACDAPAGFTAASATTPSGVTASANNIEFTTEIAAGVPEVVTINNVTNPNYVTTEAAGEGFYARVLVYDDTTAAGDYVDADTIGSPTDSGGIAMAITQPIEVSAAVRETMTFCVSAAAPTASCGGVTTPAIELGEGTPKALTTTQASTASVTTQISTNASKGAIVSMKINNNCGGLKRAEASVCDIPPVTTGTNSLATAGARFGMKVGTPVNIGTDFAGAVNAATNYASADYGMNFDDNDVTGVTSPYGDEIYDTDDAPINDVNVPLTFAARAAITTPAGLYRADMNLVATGTF